MADSINKHGEGVIHCDWPKCMNQLNIEDEPSTGWTFSSIIEGNYPDKDYCPEHAGREDELNYG